MSSPPALPTLLAVALLAGCAAPAAELAPPVGLPPLPDAIHDERDVVVSTSGSAAGLPCGEVRNCVEHPFTLPREGELRAMLSWGVPGNVPWLRVFQEGEQVAGETPVPGDTKLALNLVLAPGAYVLRVDVFAMAADRWVLDASFAEPSQVPSFHVTTLPLTCASHCLEPTVAVGPAGHVYAINSFGFPLDVAVSEDDGDTWTLLPGPALPPGAFDGYQTDAMLQVSPAGRLYFSAIVIRVVGGVALKDGVQVAWSDDGARSWQSAHVTHAQGRPELATVDRQWLGFGARGELYLTWLSEPSGIWISRSDDGGATWNAASAVVAVHDSPGGVHGPPVVDADGRVFMPKCRLAADRSSLDVYVSEDQGLSWTRHLVAEVGCIYFPILVAAPDGSLVVAWHDHKEGALNQRGDVHVARSADAGVTWSSPVRWGVDTLTSPWPLARADGWVDLVWYAENEDRVSSRAIVARGPADGAPVSEVELPSFAHFVDRHSPQTTDFAHAARTPDGRIVATWTNGRAITVAVEDRASP